MMTNSKWIFVFQFERAREHFLEIYKDHIHFYVDLHCSFKRFAYDAMCWFTPELIWSSHNFTKFTYPSMWTCIADLEVFIVHYARVSDSSSKLYGLALQFTYPFMRTYIAVLGSFYGILNLQRSHKLLCGLALQF